jgi:hypothetical protein
MGRAGGSLGNELPSLAKVAVDWDATAFSFLDSLMRHPNFTDEMHEKLHPSTCDHWDHPVTLLGLEAMEEVRTLEIMRDIGVYPGFVQSMRHLQTMGYEPVILTHNSENTIGLIKTYIAELGLDLEVLRARPAEKIAWCKENNCKVLFDDSPETILLAAEAGITPISFRFGYNAHAIDQAGALNIPQGSNWSALLALAIGVLEPSEVTAQ